MSLGIMGVLGEPRPQERWVPSLRRDPPPCINENAACRILIYSTAGVRLTSPSGQLLPRSPCRRGRRSTPPPPHPSTAGPRSSSLPPRHALFPARARFLRAGRRDGTRRELPYP